MACETFNFEDDGTKCLAVRIGFDYRTAITYTDSDSAAIDLTGTTITMTIKEKKKDVAAILTLTNSATLSVSGLYIPDPDTGQFTVNIINADTSNLQDKTYLYEIDLEDSGGLKTLFLEGNLVATTGVLL